jgi:hypothetical protein
MRVSKNQVTLLSAAVAALFAVGAQAQNVGLAGSGLVGTTPTTISGASGGTYASEINNNIAIAQGGLFVNTVYGIGTSANQLRYVKFTLNGATFQQAVTNANLSNTTVIANSTSTITNLVTTTVTPLVVIGGTALSNNVVFQVTTPTGSNTSDAIAFSIPGGVNIASTASPVTVTYEVYEFLSDATSSTKQLYSRTGTIGSFAPTVSFANNSTTVPTQVATSISGFKSLNAGTSGSSAAAANQAVIGQLNLALATNASGNTRLISGSTVANLNEIVGTGTSQITVTGDFAAAAANTSVQLFNGAGTLVANAIGGSAFTSTSATFNLNASGGLSNHSVRYLVNGTTSIPASGYSAALTTNPSNANYKAASASISSIGTITRDGVTYESPWATATTGFLSRYFLTQTAGSAVSWSAVVRNPNGIVTGGTLSGSLASGQVTQITLASLLPEDTSTLTGPFQVTFTIAADASQVRGSYVLTTQATGAVTTVPLYRASAR